MKNRILLASFFCFFILLFNVAQAAETEPNNTAATANVLPLNGSNSGAINPAGDVDWYKVTTTSDGQLNITVTPTSGKYMWIYLYDNNGTILLNSGNSNTTFTVGSDGLAAGTYYVQVNTYYSSDTSSYTISSALTTIAQPNDAEPDSTRALALTLPLNNKTTGHINYYYNNHRDSADWYKITTTGDGLLKLTLTSNNGQYVWAYLYDNDGVTVLNSNNTNGTLDISTDGLAAGTYYVRINTYYNNGFAPYTLADTLNSPSQANDAEPNGTKAQALALALNGSVTGHIDYYYNNHRDSADWYKVTTTGDGLLRLRLTSNNGQYVWAYLFDNDGVTVVNSNNTNGTLDISTDGLAAGTYYVRINTYYNNGFAPYTLADSLFSPTQVNDKEPNDTKATADSFAVNSTITGHTDYYYNNHRDSADWYKLTLPQDGLLRLRLTSNNGQYVWAYLFDNDGVTVVNSNNTNGTLDISTDGLAAGTYYVRVNTYYNTGFAPYTLADSLFTYNAVDSEPNKYFSQAKTILSNRVTTGHVDFYYNNTRDTVDTYKVNYTGSNGNLNFTLNLLPHNIDGSLNYTWFQVYKDTTASPIYNNNFNNASTQINLTGLTQGYYYVKVFEYYNSNFEAYSIADSFTQVNIAAISIKSQTSPDSCSTNSITYNLSASHSPYSVMLYRNGVKADSMNVAADTVRFNNLSDGNYYATVYGDGATGTAFGTSATTQFLPPAPKGLTTSNIGVHTAQLNWTLLSCEKSYRLQYKPTSAGTWTNVDQPNNTTGMYTVAGLSPYTNYTWRVASVDTAQGTVLVSAYSDSVTFITLSDTAHIMLASKTNGTTCNSSTLVYNLSNSVAPYTVQLYRYKLAYGNAMQATGTATFSSLPSGIYYATATGTGSGGSIGISGIDTIATPVPTGLDTGLITATTAQLKWTPVSCAKYFTVQYKVAGAATWITIVTKGNTSSDTLTGLLAATKYVWQIASVDSANGITLNGVYSVTDTFMTTSVLPVTLINFTAKPAGNIVQVNWQTVNETNSKYFEVLRSSDGIAFSAVGTVSAFGNSTLQHQYSFNDNSPLKGTNYYRLRQIDNDGRYADSKTISISFNGSSLFVLYPNPAVDVVHLNFSTSASSTITVYDMNGKALLQKIISDGSSSQNLNVSSFAAGIYTIVLQQNKQKQTIRFEKK